MNLVFTDSFSEVLNELVNDRVCIIITTREIERFVSLEKALDERDIRAQIIHVQDGEGQKDLGTVADIINGLGERAFPRDGLIVGVGGGATTDLAGFVASIWMRGVEWIAIPTTLAGMVDAAIGGKTGINIPTGK